MLSGSLRSLDEIRSDPGAWIPHHLTFGNFTRLFQTAGFGRFLTNSLVVAAIVVAGNVVAGSAAGYVLAKFEFGASGSRSRRDGRVDGAVQHRFVTQFVITVDAGLGEHAHRHRAAELALPLSVFVMRQYALSIPDELLEAARIDGAASCASSPGSSCRSPDPRSRPSRSCRS